jgi:hypothetical protein
LGSLGACWGDIGAAFSFYVSRFLKRLRHAKASGIIRLYDIFVSGAQKDSITNFAEEGGCGVAMVHKEGEYELSLGSIDALI